jgi:CHAT domain-containing protein
LIREGSGGGVGYLLVGNSAAAIDALKTTSLTHDAAAENDLAGALLTRAGELDDPSLTADALAAADDALRMDARFAPALFNRALALGQIGLRSEARRAWIRYLQVDPSSPWADEAAHRLGQLSVSSQIDEWQKVSEKERQLPMPDAAEKIGRYARRYPQQARQWTETVVMTDWAVATLKPDPAAAAKSLEIARHIGATLRELSGESLLCDSVAAADSAITHGTVAPLARAYMTYSEGQAANRMSHTADAEVKFRQAAAMFKSTGSPMEYVARHYIGTCLHAQLKLAEAAEVAESLAGEHLDRRGYRAIDATSGWERGACFMERGAISRSIEVFTRSRDTFLQLGEIDLAAVMDGYLASADAYVGDETEAWRAWRRAFEALSRSGNRYRLLVIVGSAGAAAARSKEWSRALALLTLSGAEAERQNKPIVATELFTFLARVNAERGDVGAASVASTNARRWATKLDDASARARAQATLAFVDGLMLRANEPARSQLQLTEALHFFEQTDRRVEVPRIYLERASVKAQMGDVSGARGDLETGIEAVELERRQVHDFAQRATLLASFDALFEKAIDLAMKTGDQEHAFALSERYRARALTDMFELGSDPSANEVKPLSLADLRTALAPDAAIIEYSILPDRIIAFVIRRPSFSAVTTSITRDRVSELLKAFQQNGRAADVMTASSAADQVLLQPIRYALTGATHIVVVPDRYAANVPFAALYDSVSSRFLIENAAIAIAPSATLAVNASTRATTAGRRSSILAIAGSTFDTQHYPDAPPLDHVNGEANDVASLYATSRVLAGEEATPTAVTTALANSDVVHFAAHGVATRPVADTALLLAPSPTSRGTLRVGDIARLNLRKTRVVVLAACSSAAPVTLGDGVENLSLAFLAAGVPTTVGSLSDIDDRTSAPLMRALHQRIAAGTDPSAAVRSIVMEEIRDSQGHIRLPLRWLSIVVVGGSDDLLTRERKGRS